MADCHVSVARATVGASGCGPTLTSPTLPCGVGMVTGTDVERMPNCEKRLAAFGVWRYARSSSTAWSRTGSVATLMRENSKAGVPSAGVTDTILWSG